METYCYKCHDDDTQKGDRQFDNMTFDLANPHTGEALQEILDQLNLGEMPPKKNKKQPLTK